MANPSSDQFVPALRFNVLTPIFDPVLRWTLRDKSFKRTLISQANVEDGFAVLDVGCGTGTLLLELNAQFPECSCVGLDGDPSILDLARKKTAAVGGSNVTYDHAMSFRMPYDDASFDRVFSSLFFHHLTHDNKVRTLREIIRVLKPGGQFHVADWGKPANSLMRLAFYQIQFLDGFETTSDNLLGRLPDLMQEAGFKTAHQAAHLPTVFGTLALYAASK